MPTYLWSQTAANNATARRTYRSSNRKPVAARALLPGMIQRAPFSMGG
jgi:hypothetical protein